MTPIIRKGALAAALLGVGFSPALTLAASPSPSSPPANSANYRPDQVLILKEAGKPDRQCVILSAKKSRDGTTTYQVKALDNGEMMTIYDRVPAESGKSTPAEPVAKSAPVPGSLGMNPNKISVTDVASNPPPAPEPAATAARHVTSSDSGKPGLLRSLFGRSQPQNPPGSVRTTCPVQTPAPGQVPGNPAVAMPDAPAGVAAIPTSLWHVSQKPMPQTVPAEPNSLPIQENSSDPVQQTIAYQQNRTAELKEALKSAERPSHRLVAAQELASGTRGQSPDVRAVLMLAAQDDPAGSVRSACIRYLSLQGVRDQAFMTLLVTAQNDKDASVREEAGYALQKMSMK